MKTEFLFDYHGSKIRVNINKYGGLSGGNSYIEYNDNALLTTVNYSLNDSGLSYFPLQINFLEKFYAIGMIPGGFNKREGKPSEHAVLVSRAIDRTFRPLFNEDIRNEIQIINSLMSSSGCINNKILGIIGTSIAIQNSHLPFKHLVGACEVGFINDKYIINPDHTQRNVSKFLILVSGTDTKINMIEFEGEEIDKEIVFEAVKQARQAIDECIEFQKTVIASIQKEKLTYALHDSNLEKNVVPKILLENYPKFFEDYSAEDLSINHRRQMLTDFITQKKSELLKVCDVQDIKIINNAVWNINKFKIKSKFFETGVRIDNRGEKDIRRISSKIDALKRTHGSGLFTRGNTQVMSITTLGSLHEYQIVENTQFDSNKYFFHQYNFLPFSTGDIKRLLPPNRREIGHGALAESALKQVIPTTEKFPYVIRQVSEVLSSNGSTSQASICAASLSLMAAGVPITNHVAGISVGLLTKDSGETILLTDIQGLEDHIGEMDFKVSSTKKGICAIQLDTKIEGLSLDLIYESIIQAEAANLEIIANMDEIISAPRENVSSYAPKYEQFFIDPDKIKLVIGSGGKTINEIIEKNDNVKIDIIDTGKVVIYHQNESAVLSAKSDILEITTEPKIGDKINDAEINSIKDFGIFVKISHSLDGLIPQSFLSFKGVDINKLNVGQKIDIKIVDVHQNKIKLDIINEKDLVTLPVGQTRNRSNRGSEGREGRFSRGGRGDFRRDSSRFDRDGGSRKPRDYYKKDYQRKSNDFDRDRDDGGSRKPRDYYKKSRKDYGYNK